MTKAEAERLVDALERPDGDYDGDVNAFMQSMEPLSGLALPEFEQGKYVPFKSALNFLTYQCVALDGTILYGKVSETLELMQRKQVTIV